MIRWAINGALFVLTIAAALFFFRFSFEDDGLMIRLRAKEQRDELLDKVERVKDTGQDLADSVRELDQDDAHDAIKKATSKAQKIAADAVNNVVEESVAEHSSRRAGREAEKETKEMDSDGLEAILEEGLK